MALAAARGHGFSVPSTVGQFLLAAVRRLLAGTLVALGVRLSRGLRLDPLMSNAISLATRFAAYLLGEQAHVSGVLAVVVAGLIVGYDAPRSASGASRLQTGAVWQLVDFLLEGLVSLLIGRQLPAVVRGLESYPATTIAVALSITLGVVLLVRPLWLLLTQSLPRSLHTQLGGSPEEGDSAADLDRRSARDDRNSRRLTRREVVVLSWSGPAASSAWPRSSRCRSPPPVASRFRTGICCCCAPSSSCW